MAAGPSNYKHEAINPENPKGPKIDVIFPADLFLRYYKYNPVRYENLRAAKYVLDNTERIFGEIRQFSEGGWCYVGKPTEWYIEEGVVEPFPGELIFAVYLNPKMRVYECRAEPVADDDPMCPRDWKNRYGALVWKNTS